MKNWWLIVGLWASTWAWADEPTLTHLSDFWAAAESERAAGLNYRFEVDVLYYDASWLILQVEDESLAEYLHSEKVLPVKAGQRVVISGRTRAPATTFSVEDASFQIVGEAKTHWLPINVDEVDHASLVNYPVEVEGLVESHGFDGPEHLKLNLVSDGRRLSAWVLLDPIEPVPTFDGMMVKLRGVHAARFDGSKRMTTLDLFTPGLDLIEVEAPLAQSSYFDRSAIAIKDMGGLGRENPVKVSGRVARVLEDGSVLVRDESGQVTVTSAQREAFAVGQDVEIVGLPQVEGVEARLIQALIHVRSEGSESAPTDSTKDYARVLHRIAATALELSPEQAARNHPVRLSGAVTWSNPRSMIFYLQDSSGGIGVYRADAAQAPPLPGRHVTVNGVSVMGDYAPMVQVSQVTELGDVVVPRPRRVSLEQALTGVEEAQWVEMSGYVHQVRREGAWARLEMTATAGPLVARLPGDERAADLVGAVVIIRGVCTAITDDERKLTGVELWVPDMESVTVLDEGNEDIWSMPTRGLNEVGRFNTASDQRRRIKVEGTVLHWDPKGWVYLQDGEQRLLVQTRREDPLTPGTRVMAAGFQGREGGRTVLRETMFRQMGEVALPPPIQATDLREVRRNWDGCRVRLRGRVVERFQAGGASLFALQQGRTVFECVLSQIGPDEALPEPDSLVTVEGVYHVVFDDRARPVSFQVLLGHASQIVEIEPPRWWTRDRILVVAGMLVGGVALVLGWVWTLQRRVSKQAYEINEQIRRATQLESELQQALRLESLGSLAGGIAHDFNNQLTVIMDHLAGLGASESLTKEGVERLEESRQTAMMARDLTHRLLTFAKGGAPRFASVDLERLASETVSTFGLPASVEVVWRVAGPCVPIWADEGQVKQLLQNVLLNASQAMLRGGTLTVEIDEAVQDEAKASLLPPGRYVRLVVRDNGEGISDRHLPQVFDPYFTTRENAQGLGLAVVYTIARRHGGRVTVSSKAMVGTEVQVWWPTSPRETGSRA